MSQIIIELDDGTEVMVQPTGETNYSGASDRIGDAFKRINQKVFNANMKTIGKLLHSSAKSISEVDSSTEVESITITTGVNLNTEANLVIANVSTEISFEVSVTYKKGS